MFATRGQGREASLRDAVNVEPFTGVREQSRAPVFIGSVPMPDTPEELDALIDTVAAGPKSVTVDGRSATAQSLTELEDIRDRRAERVALTRSRLPIRQAKIEPNP